MMRRAPHFVICIAVRTALILSLLLSCDVSRAVNPTNAAEAGGSENFFLHVTRDGGATWRVLDSSAASGRTLPNANSM